MSIYLEAKAMAGDSVSTVCWQLCELANRVGITVRCHFNGVTLIVTTNGNPHTLEQGYWKASQAGQRVKVATAL